MKALVPLNTTDLPEVHDIIAMLRRTVEEFPDRLLIGEIYLPVERLVAYYGRDSRRRPSAVQFRDAQRSLGHQVHPVPD
jgi:hypothetical protein